MVRVETVFLRHIDYQNAAFEQAGGVGESGHGLMSLYFLATATRVTSREPDLPMVKLRVTVCFPMTTPSQE